MRPHRRLGKVQARLAARDREGPRRRVVVYLPRKDGDARPLGVVSRAGNVLTVLYEPGRPDPPLPAGW